MSASMKVAYSERTGPRIRAFLASMRPLRACSGLVENDDFQRGRSLIEQLALWHDCADAGEGEAFTLSTTDCADILKFLSSCEPVNGKNWWHDTDQPGPSHLCGYFAILEAMEEDLRLVP